MADRPRILIWDIETAPLVVTTWGLRPDYIPHQAIVEESTILSAAWKWFEEDEVYDVSVNPDRPKNDRAVTKRLHKVLGDADVLVAHNGDKFDLRKFNARAIYYELDPLPKIPTIDTLKVARRVFSFNSNRLDYLGKFLCGEGKIKTDPDLWTAVLGKEPGALEKMVEYNRGDVLVLEKVYERLRPYIKNHPNAALYNDTVCCTNCGSETFQRRGFKYQATTKRQQYQCQICGAWFCGAFEGRSEVR